MNRILFLTENGGRLIALGMLLMVPSVRAQSACTTQITHLVSWLKSPPPKTERSLNAIVASHQWTGVVTYTSIPMVVATAFGIDWLTPKAAGSQYFSNVTYATNPPHPFSPAGIKTNKVVVQKTGVVTVKPNNGTVTHTFTVRCDQGSSGVMHGFPPAAPLHLPSPYYTISWIKQESPTIF
jgi:hypothetical protein